MKRWSLLVVCLFVGALIGMVVTNTLLQGQVSQAVAVPKELTSYRDVVKKVLPAVVSIQAKAVVKHKQIRGNLPDDLPIPEEFRKYFEMPRTPEQEGPSALGFGSGFIVDPKGVILTNNHVVDGADQVEVQLGDGRKFTSKDVKTDPKTDLAIVRIDARGALPHLELGDSSTMEIGDRVLAIGAPFGLTGTVTSGIVSAKGRSLHVNMYEDFLQTDAAINPGNSGGPLVNLEGKVIGINAAIKSRSGGFQGVGMAVSSNLARNVMDQLLKNGVVRRGYLGVQIKDIENPEVAAKLGLKDTHGVVVTQVFDNAPAKKAGIQDGDVITSLGGNPVKDGRDMQSVVASLPLGKPVEVTVMRDGAARSLEVTIEEQPQQFGTTRVAVPRGQDEKRDGVALDKVGVEVTDLTPELAESFGYRDGAKGVLVTRVENDGMGALAGLRRGMLVMKVNKQPVTSATAMRDALKAGPLEQGVLLQVQTPQGGTSYLVLKAAGTEK
jgi:serine protease Do